MVETEGRIYVELPVEKEFARLLRLLISGIASRMNFDLDTVDDLKIAVEEAFIMAIRRQATSPLKVVFNIGADSLQVDFKGIGKPNIEEGQTDNFGNFILEAVVDEMKVVEADDGYDLRLVKNR